MALFFEFVIRLYAGSLENKHARGRITECIRQLLYAVEKSDNG